MWNTNYHQPKIMLAEELEKILESEPAWGQADLGLETRVR
jgi:hypothetical protein